MIEDTTAQPQHAMRPLTRLAHLWEVWSKAEGLETREPYPMEILGHVKIMVPEDGG